MSALLMASVLFKSPYWFLGSVDIVFPQQLVLARGYDDITFSSVFF